LGSKACAAWSLTLKARATRLSTVDPAGVSAFTIEGTMNARIISGKNMNLISLIMTTSIWHLIDHKTTYCIVAARKEKPC